MTQIAPTHQDMSETDQSIFTGLGFSWDRKAIPGAVPVHSVHRATFRFHKLLAEFVWDASMLEDNPFTYPQVQTVLDGITVGGQKISDFQQVLNLAESAKLLLSMVKSGKFQLDKKTYTEIHSHVARNEALEWGHFRGEGEEANFTPYVRLGMDVYEPEKTAPGAPVLNAMFQRGLDALGKIEKPLERGMATFLFGALHQFFFDGNKRTARFMMNGILMSNGIDAISVAASKKDEFNKTMVDFYRTKNAAPMMQFLLDCHPDKDAMKPENPKSPSEIEVTASSMRPPV